MQNLEKELNNIERDINNINERDINNINERDININERDINNINESPKRKKRKPAFKRMLPALAKIRRDSLKILQKTRSYDDFIYCWKNSFRRACNLFQDTKNIDLVSSLFIETPEDIVLYRGMGKRFDEKYEMKKGTVLEWIYPQSFSSSKSIAAGFTDKPKGEIFELIDDDFIEESDEESDEDTKGVRCCLLEVTIPKGTPIFYISSICIWDHGSDRGSQLEFILPPGRIVLDDVITKKVYIQEGMKKLQWSVITSIGTFFYSGWEKLRNKSE